MDEIKELYFGNATINKEEEDRIEFEKSKPEFLHFLETD